MPTLRAKRLLADKGIRVIQYTRGHEELAQFLRKLAEPYPLQLAEAEDRTEIRRERYGDREVGDSP
jgi:hypothetical protein